MPVRAGESSNAQSSHLRAFVPSRENPPYPTPPRSAYCQSAPRSLVMSNLWSLRTLYGTYTSLFPVQILH